MKSWDSLLTNVALRSSSGSGRKRDASSSSRRYLINFIPKSTIFLHFFLFSAYRIPPSGQEEEGGDAGRHPGHEEERKGGTLICFNCSKEEGKKLEEVGCKGLEIYFFKLIFKKVRRVRRVTPTCHTVSCWSSDRSFQQETFPHVSLPGQINFVFIFLFNFNVLLDCLRSSLHCRAR